MSEIVYVNELCKIYNENIGNLDIANKNELYEQIYRDVFYGLNIKFYIPPKNVVIYYKILNNNEHDKYSSSQLQSNCVSVRANLQGRFDDNEHDKCSSSQLQSNCVSVRSNLQGRFYNNIKFGLASKYGICEECYTIQSFSEIYFDDVSSDCYRNAYIIITKSLYNEIKNKIESLGFVIDNKITYNIGAVGF